MLIHHIRLHDATKGYILFLVFYYCILHYSALYPILARNLNKLRVSLTTSNINFVDSDYNVMYRNCRAPTETTVLVAEGQVLVAPM